MVKFNISENCLNPLKFEIVSNDNLYVMNMGLTFKRCKGMTRYFSFEDIATNTSKDCFLINNFKVVENERQFTMSFDLSIVSPFESTYSTIEVDIDNISFERIQVIDNIEHTLVVYLILPDKIITRLLCYKTDKRTQNRFRKYPNLLLQTI